VQRFASWADLTVMPTLDRLLWLFPVAFVAHVAEEAPGFTRWAQAHARSDYTSRDFAHNNIAGAILTGTATIAITRRPRRAPFALYTAALTQQAVGNAAFHAGTRAPGGATAMGLVLPLWALITRAALREGLLTPRRVAASVLAGTTLHALAVRRQVYGR
jgi:Protein of unknown function with HXXEE motif